MGPSAAGIAQARTILILAMSVLMVAFLVLLAYVVLVAFPTIGLSTNFQSISPIRAFLGPGAARLTSVVG